MHMHTWLGGVALECWTCDQEVAGSMPGRAPSGDNSGQVANTHVPLFTKQYNLVPCEGFMSTRRHVAAIHGSNEQGKYCSSGFAVFSCLNRDTNYLLYFTFYTHRVTDPTYHPLYSSITGMVTNKHTPKPIPLPSCPFQSSLSSLPSLFLFPSHPLLSFHRLWHLLAMDRAWHPRNWSVGG